MIRVAYVFGALNQGGTESLILDVCSRYKQVPYQLVCIYRKEGNLAALFHQSGAELRCVPKTKSLIRYIIDLRHILIQEHVDIIHAQTPSSALVCLIAKKGLHIKLVSTMHGFTFRNAPWWYRNLILHRSDKVLFVSEYEKEYYDEKVKMDANITRYQVVYNGINFEKINKAIPNAELLENHRPKLMMVGNFNTVRSQYVVVQSIAKLKQSGIDNFDFYFVGKRTQGLEHLYDDCEELCKKEKLTNVHFLGARDDVPSLLKSVDGFVYSSASDTFGIAVVEAMAAGLPVIVNDWAVMKEITKNGQWATLFKTENAEDCAHKIENLLHQLKERKAQAQGIAKEVRKEYSIEKHIERLTEIYNSII